LDFSSDTLSFLSLPSPATRPYFTELFTESY
jgi:hypothetical protein